MNIQKLLENKQIMGIEAVLCYRRTGCYQGYLEGWLANDVKMRTNSIGYDVRGREALRETTCLLKMAVDKRNALHSADQLSVTLSGLVRNLDNFNEFYTFILYNNN